MTITVEGIEEILEYASSDPRERIEVSPKFLAEVLEHVRQLRKRAGKSPRKDVDSALPDFGEDRSTCAKCGTANASTQFLAGRVVSRFGVCGPALLRTCSCCGFEWGERPIDERFAALESEQAK